MRIKKLMMLALLLGSAAVPALFLFLNTGTQQCSTVTGEGPVRVEDTERALPPKPAGKKSGAENASTTAAERAIPQNIRKEFKRTTIYFFHGNDRDATCNAIERYTRVSLGSYFSERIASGMLVFRVVNTGEPWNAHFIDDFKIGGRSLVIIEPSAGGRIRWKALGDAERLVDDRNAFMNYIRDEVSAFGNDR